MRAVAIIKELNSNESNQWQFDKVMSAIAYDIDLKVVFMPNAISQITKNKAWKSLSLYGVDAVYFLNSNKIVNYKNLIGVDEINSIQLSKYIKEADIII